MFPFRRKIPGFSVALFLFSSAFLALAQESVTISLLPVPFGPDDKASCVSLREDGALVAFQSRRPDGRGGADIWLSRFQNGKWSEPYNAGPGVNTSANEVDAKLSTDGKTMVFIRGQNFKESSGIYISRFRNGAWSEGELVGPPVTLPHTIQFGAVLTRDGKRLYFASNRSGGYGGLDNYYSDWDGAKWSEPTNLGPVINTPGDDGDLAISRDGKTLIFPNRGSDSVNGSIDLYLSRFADGSWSAPVNLGSRINTPYNDTCPWLGYDGYTLYFNSELTSSLMGQKGSSRIWKVRYSKRFDESGTGK